VISFAVGLFAGINLLDAPVVPLAAPPSMSQCTTDTATSLNQNQPLNADILRQATEHCYSLIRSHGLLKDFANRELNFVQQYRANGVLMWMVVAVTLSGVLLAGLQLMASYELARTNRKFPVGNSEFSLKRFQVVLKSSVTGLFILVMSFAFFLVFVFYVYRFEQVENQTLRIPTQTPILPMGELGPPVTPK
jgi:ABC-type multidrug transport system fused ATPase/permease subunit